jgi:hypothetical protein
MSAESSSFDPYRSPSLPEAPFEAAAPAGRPGLLTTLCVLCIVLGALGILNSLLGAAGAIGGKMLQAAIQPKGMEGVPPEMQDAQDKFQADVNAVQDKYFWGIVPALGFRFVAALLLLIGGIKALSLQESGRKLLLVACAVAVGFEICHAILQSLVNLDMMTAVNSYVEVLTDSMPQGKDVPPQMGNFMQTIVRASIIGGLIFAYVIALLKITLYLFGLIYLQKERIRNLFHSPAALTPAP